MKLKHLKIGQEIKFEIKGTQREHPITVIGKIESIKDLFGGLVYIEPGAVCQDGFIVRADSL